MKLSNLNSDTLISVHCYAGDRNQIDILRPMYEHHEAPIVIVSPANSQVHGYGPHHTRCAGGVGYVGQVSWDRQYAQMKLLLEYPQKWYLLHDSDSILLTPKIPAYLYEDENLLYGNVVDDFRKPGESFQGSPPFPLDYHENYRPLQAIQPAYWCSRKVLQKIVDTCEGLQACPITPFIDFQIIVMCKTAGVEYRSFRNGASCETSTPNGLAVMRQCIAERGATAVHSIKSLQALNMCREARKQWLKSHPNE